MPARLLDSRGWNVPSWVWTLAFGVFAAGAYWLWTDGISPWLDQLSNAGFGGTDLMSMILFSGAFWEGWGDMVDIIANRGLDCGGARRHRPDQAALAAVHGHRGSHVGTPVGSGNAAASQRGGCAAGTVRFYLFERDGPQRLDRRRTFRSG